MDRSTARGYRQGAGKLARVRLLGVVSMVSMVLALALAACGGVPGGPIVKVTPELPTPTTTPIPFTRPEFQAGVVFPRWGTNVYGPTDADWMNGLADVHDKTGARWMEMVVTLFQQTLSSTTVQAGSMTPTPQDVAAGILAAKQAGFKVFVVPHLLVVQGNVPDAWGGFVKFSDRTQAAAWFDGYWQALKPYAEAAAQYGADQLAIGNEYIGLEPAPADLWNLLITRVRGVYHGAITYNTNWSSLAQRAPAWMANAQLAYIGVSAYQSLTTRPMRLTVAQIEGVWRQELLPLIDRYSRETGKHVLISEIGYRNSGDALYQPWLHTASLPPDPSLQAAAYEGALRAALGDHAIDGIYFYAWENPPWAPSPQAAAVLHSIYLSPLA